MEDGIDYIWNWEMETLSSLNQTTTQNPTLICTARYDDASSIQNTSMKGCCNHHHHHHRHQNRIFNLSHLRFSRFSQPVMVDLIEFRPCFSSCCCRCSTPFIPPLVDPVDPWSPLTFLQPHVVDSHRCGLVVYPRHPPATGSTHINLQQQQTTDKQRTAVLCLPQLHV